MFCSKKLNRWVENQLSVVADILTIRTSATVVICSKLQIRWSFDYRFLPLHRICVSQYENGITTFFTFLIWFDVHIQQFLGLKFSTKLNRGILGLLDKFTIPETYRFPLANPQKGPSLDCVPELNLLN